MAGFAPAAAVAPVAGVAVFAGNVNGSTFGTVMISPALNVALGIESLEQFRAGVESLAEQLEHRCIAERRRARLLHHVGRDRRDERSRGVLGA